jgi:hypothetical protein
MLRPKVETTPMCSLLLDIKGVGHYEFVPRQQSEAFSWNVYGKTMFGFTINTLGS